MLELLENIGLLHYPNTIVAAEPQRVLSFHTELGLNRLSIRNARRICTANNSPNRIRQLNPRLLSHLIVPNNANGGAGSDQRYLVHFTGLELSILDLDNVLLVLLLRDHVHRHTHDMPFTAVYSENLEHVQSMAGKNMVDHCTVTDLLHVELFWPGSLGQDLDPVRRGTGFILNSLPETRQGNHDRQVSRTKVPDPPRRRDS